MNATRMLRPSASSPMSVLWPSASTSPLAIKSPTFTSGFWLMLVFWFERVYLVRLYISTPTSPGLALHVRTHERAVGVVMLEERNQRGRHRHDLRRRDVNVFHLARRGQHELVLETARHQLVDQGAAAANRG